MNWLEEAESLFDYERPKYFTEENPKLESFDHNETLSKTDVDSIGIEELGNPCWDPICFVNDAGYLYFFPAFVRLCINTTEDDYYIGQFLFHITYEGLKNRRIKLLDKSQKKFLKEFVGYLYLEKSKVIENYADEDEIENALSILERI